MKIFIQLFELSISNFILKIYFLILKLVVLIQQVYFYSLPATTCLVMQGTPRYHQENCCILSM